MAHKELTAVVGEYTNAKGEVKKRYAKVGALIESKHGPMVKIDFVPIGWNGYAYVNDPYDPNAPRQQKQSQHRDDMPEDDVPF